jgi:hypothetical protein
MDAIYQLHRNSIAQMIGQSVAYETILEIGISAATYQLFRDKGGRCWTKSIIGRKHADGWRFCAVSVDGDSVGLSDKGGKPVEGRFSEWVDSLEIALMLLGHNWHEESILGIHPNFRRQIWDIVSPLCEFAGGFWGRRSLNRWRECCGIAENEPEPPRWQPRPAPGSGHEQLNKPSERSSKDKLDWIRRMMAPSIDQSIAYDVVIGIGGELWSRTIVGVRDADQWRFCVNSIDQSGELLNDDDRGDEPTEIRRVSIWVDSFDLALLLLGGWWYRTYPRVVHAEFRPRVWQLVSMLDRFDVGQTKLDRWKDCCGVGTADT